MNDSTQTPGLIALFGSGETAASSGVVYDRLAQRVDKPLRVALLETPAGFQPNADRVAGKVAEFLAVRLQNERPELTQVPARKRGTALSPDDAEVVAPLRHANLIFMGPGSPTYAARQLEGSLAWELLRARLRRGAALATASAATIAVGSWVLPVYEIYKVGSDLHWQRGLDLLRPYGLSLALIPHWNNAEGGVDLDTSFCFMGQARWLELLPMLPAETTVVGIDEHTTLLLDLADRSCQVLGRGSVTLLQQGVERVFARGSRFGIEALGPYRPLASNDDISLEVWELSAPAEPPASAASPSPEVLALVEARRQARGARDWARADALRGELAVLGWAVRDTPDGMQLDPIDSLGSGISR
jgi:hypothetical protein